MDLRREDVWKPASQKPDRIKLDTAHVLTAAKLAKPPEPLISSLPSLDEAVLGAKAAYG